MDKEPFKTVKISSTEAAKICIVDDDKFVVNMIGRSLNMAGFGSIGIYDSGESFIRDVLDDGKGAGIVISDLVLPGMTGFELCRKVKQALPETPVILISSFEIEDVYSKVLESGADDFIAKPFNPIELNTRIKLHLARAEKANSHTAEKRGQIRPPNNMPFIGDIVGDYIITDTIGWGKSSFIFKATRKASKTVYTLKMLAAHAAGFKDMASRFENEVGMMEKIKHPNVVSFVEKGMCDTIPYVVMEYINGLDLESFLITKGKVPLQEGLAISHGIASAIAEVHAHRIIHRDIKLKNIIFDIASKSPKLIDFGIAKESGSTHLTRDGFVLGTPIYMAPEIFEGEEATAKSDIYSFGATIYHLLTGSPPFVGESSRDLYKKHLAETPPPMGKFRDDIPDDIEQLVSRMPCESPVQEAGFDARHRGQAEKTRQEALT